MRRNTVRDGYGQPHRRLRARWAAVVQAGRVKCVRCGKPIRPGQAWALDHADLPGRLAYRLGVYLGCSHRSCNVAARHRKPQPPRARALAFFDASS